MSHRLRLYPYCGMGPVTLIEDEELAVCRTRAARKIRRQRNDLEYPVAILQRGLSWELETGEEACMIGDGEGILTIEEIATDDDDDVDDDPEGTCHACGDPLGYPGDSLCHACQEVDHDDE